VIAPIAQKYSLTLNGEALSDAPYIGNITVFENMPHVPSPIAPFTLDSEAWTIFSRAVQASFGEEVVTAPSAMTGNTGRCHPWIATINSNALLLS
jgi:Gly-Xaa carboxypeptidase